MITAVQVRHNPVTAWEQFALTLLPSTELGSGMGFSGLSIEHRAMGGFWSSAIDVIGDEGDLRAFFQDGLGREVVCRNEAGGTDFEGFVNSMTLTINGTTIRTSLDGMSNKVWVRYRDTGDSLTRSAVASDTDSIARFGTKELVLSGGQLTASSVADNLATLTLNRRAWPKKTVADLSIGQGSKTGVGLSLACLGYWHTLDWMTYNQTASTGTTSADLQLATILANAEFVASMDLSPNTVGVTKEYDADRTIGGICQSIASLGDIQTPPQRWVLYFDVGRVVRYKPAAPGLAIG